MKLLSTLLLAATFYLPIKATSQNFAHIHTENLVSQMPEFKLAQYEIEKFTVNLQNELIEMETVYRTKVKEYEDINDTELIKKAKIQELQELEARLLAFQKNAEERLVQYQEEIQTPIIQEATKAINKVAKAEGYDYVMDSSAGTLIVVPKSRDLMELVKKEIGL